MTTIPDIHVPDCPTCGDPVTTGGCYPADRICRGEPCTCAMSESSMVNCDVHGYGAPEL